MEPELRTENDESMEYQDDELILIDEGTDDISKDEADADDDKEMNSVNSELNIDDASQNMSVEKNNQEASAAVIDQDKAKSNDRKGVLLVLNEDG